MIAHTATRDPARRQVVLGGIVVAVVLAANLVVHALDVPPQPRRADRSISEALSDTSRAVDAYESAISEPVRTGAFTVAEGMRPGVGDIAAGRYPDDVLRQMADAWVTSMQGARAALRAIDPPDLLAAAHHGYLRAMDRYVAAAESLAEAARASGPRRDDLVDAAARHGEAADDAFDAAAAEVDRVKAALARSTTEESP